MKAQRILVVYYSRTGMTRLLANMLADELDCTLEELTDLRPRHGLFGFVSRGIDGALERHTTLEPVREDPAAYELVIIATPVWNRSVCSAVRTYLSAHRGRFRKLAFALAQSSVGRSRVFQQMEELAGLAPLTTLAVTESDFLRGGYRRKVSRFAARIRAHQAGQPMQQEPEHCLDDAFA
jgi:NAD(P)H-dependent FMN reductase